MLEEKVSKVVSFLRDNYEDVIIEHMERTNDPFEILVTTVLSQRTRDENTELARERLFSVVTSPDDIVELGNKELEELIRPSGTFRQKAKRIKEISGILLKEHRDSFPNTREKLLALPGVGPKTADIVLSHGFNVPVIAVDVHVEVCSKRLGLVRKDAKYEEIRKTLEYLVPEKDRYLINVGFVKFGREICRTRNPKCMDCGLKGICEYHSPPQKK